MLQLQEGQPQLLLRKLPHPINQPSNPWKQLLLRLHLQKCSYFCNALACRACMRCWHGCRSLATTDVPTPAVVSVALRALTCNRHTPPG